MSESINIYDKYNDYFDKDLVVVYNKKDSVKLSKFLYGEGTSWFFKKWIYAFDYHGKYLGPMSLISHTVPILESGMVNVYTVDKYIEEFAKTTYEEKKIARRKRVDMDQERIRKMEGHK